MVEICKDIPLPPDAGKRGARRNLPELYIMEPGDSILIPREPKLLKSVRNATQAGRTDGSGRKFIWREVGDDHWRVWRLK